MTLEAIRSKDGTLKGFIAIGNPDIYLKFQEENGKYILKNGTDSSFSSVSDYTPEPKKPTPKPNNYGGDYYYQYDYYYYTTYYYYGDYTSYYYYYGNYTYNGKDAYTYTYKPGDYYSFDKYYYSGNSSYTYTYSDKYTYSGYSDIYKFDVYFDYKDYYIYTYSDYSYYSNYSGYSGGGGDGKVVEPLNTFVALSSKYDIKEPANFKYWAYIT